MTGGFEKMSDFDIVREGLEGAEQEATWEAGGIQTAIYADALDALRRLQEAMEQIAGRSSRLRGALERLDIAITRQIPDDVDPVPLPSAREFWEVVYAARRALEGTSDE